MQQQTQQQNNIPVNRSTFTKIILNFTPSWFSVNMGTGIISILLHNCPYQFPGLYYISLVFFILNVILFIIFSIFTLIRYIRFPIVFKLMINHPGQSLFIGTLPMGLATILNCTVLFMVPAYGHWAVDLAFALYWLDVVLTILSCFGVPFMMINYHHLTMEKMTAAWLLPIVPAVVVAASGGLIAPVLSPNGALIVLIVSYCFWGLGMGLSFLIMALYLHRLMIHKLPDAEVIVSAFLPLGPLGQGAFGIQQMSVAGLKVFTEMNLLKESISGEVIYIISTIIGLLLWGLGLWWLIHGITSVLMRFITGRIKFNMGFWGLIFPLGVFTTATISLGKDIPSAFFRILSVVFIILLALLWLWIAGKTMYKAINRSIFYAPCLAEMQRTNDTNA